MSRKTWMQEFCRVGADCCRRPRALAHSLQRWRGFREVNIEKHGLRVSADKLFQQTGCSLCRTHQCAAVGDRDYETSGSPTCPIYTEDNSVCNAGVDALLDNNNPEPMIAVLKKALKKEKAKKRRAAKRKGKK